MTDHPTCSAGYDIEPCAYPGHSRYWLAGATRGEPVPTVKVGIWRCAACCPPLAWVKEMKTLEELTAGKPMIELIAEVY